MTELKKCFQIKKGDFLRAGEVSLQIQNLLKSINYEPALIRRVAICGYEGEMNVAMHGGDGLLCIEINSDRVTLEILDNGDGIEDVELAMQEGFSTANDQHREMGFGAGMGLPNMKKNSDQITVASKKGNGTQVRMDFWREKKENKIG
jgi:anti-sigma regulatory factor (Ser/Thr protein kinase)